MISAISSFEELKSEWEKIRLQDVHDSEAASLHEAGLSELLSRVREAGASAADVKTRADLQDLAREIANHIFKITGEYKNAIIAPLISTSPISPAVLVDISRIDRYAPAQLIGRDAETWLLSDAWDKAVRKEYRRPHVITFVALGGEGKTSLVAKWAADLAHQGWPGCEAAFAWSFYSQGTREQMVSSDLFLKEALTFFGDSAMASSTQGAFEKGKRLAQLVGERRSLLILDGLEPLQYPPTSPTPGELKDQGLAALLKGLAASNRGLCVITTRYALPDLRAYFGKTVREETLTRLSRAAGVLLLQSFGVKGSLRQNIRSPDGWELWNEFEKLVEDVKGHALTLNLLGSYLRDAHAGDIRKRDLVKLEEADAEERGGQTFRVIDAHMRWFDREGDRGRQALAVLRLLGLFDRPASAAALSVLMEAPAIPAITESLVGMSDSQRNMIYARLEAASLLRVNRDTAGSLISLDVHPLLREYFVREMRRQHPDAWRSAHRRLYEHFCQTTNEGNQPVLKKLGPLYQAVVHGCLAGLQEETLGKVYRGRILRGEEAYSTMKLGAVASNLGAIACFFDSPWRHVTQALSRVDQAWVLNEAAYHLLALGRLSEAIEPMQAGREIAVQAEAWEEVAQYSSNLSQLELTIGDVSRAVEDAERSITDAERGGYVYRRMANLATFADALHQAGRRTEAELRFREAEAMQAQSQPAYPLLYSLSGFQYCDLLLAAPERVVWQMTCNRSVRPSDETVVHRETLQSVTRRTMQTLQWKTTQRWLLAIALDHLTLGRSLLQGAILEGSSLDPCEQPLQKAVVGIRRAGLQDHLPRGLLTRAWLRSLTGARTGIDSAQEDLDEAWEIAERGPMPLHMADIHLHRARLFFRETMYPWESPQHDLAEARRLIEKCGYWRRKEELEDAEKAILGGA